MHLKSIILHLSTEKLQVLLILCLSIKMSNETWT